MRFRTQISNPGLMLKIIRSLKQTATTCVLKLSPEVVGFIVTGPEVGPEGVQIWSQIKVSTLFDQYRIESRQNNEIHLDLNIESFAKALRSAEAALESSGSARGFGWGDNDADAEGGTGVIMKLAKKNDKAVLVFEIKAYTNAGHPLQVNHDVGVFVLAPAKVKELREPCCPTPDLFITLPSLVMLKGLATRLSHLAPRVNVSGNNQGTLTFSVENDGMQLDTTWTNLSIPPFTSTSNANEDAEPQEASQLANPANLDLTESQEVNKARNGKHTARLSNGDPEDQPASDQMFQVTIGTKSLLKFLSTNVSNSGTIACICDDYCLICYIYIGDVADNAGVLTIFIPKMQD
ncbi:Checkpoint protein hus1 [Naganishia albida]|nr:Checkpoint protein hus1 [Naganishia albida]